MELLIKRYRVLKAVSLLQPTGRRSISFYLDLTERTVRNEIELLNRQKLIETTKSGMFITEEGMEILEKLEPLTKEYLGISVLEQQVKDILKVKQVIIVQGNCDENEEIKKEIGNAAAKVFLAQIQKESVISITGGSTVAEFVESIPEFSMPMAKLVVPARGSIGRRLEYQSNTLTALLAAKLKSEYKLLNFPDTMSTKTLNEIKNEPEIQDALNRLQQASILIVGIGNALEMAKKRHVSDTIYDFLVRKEAVAEAFGYYFDANGEIVYISRSISIKLENISKISSLIAVAGGAQKGASIISVAKNISNGIVVIDEGAATEIIKLSMKEK